MAQLEFVGGLVIQARDPQALARWYNDKFGIMMGLEHEGGMYGGFKAGFNEFHFGIQPCPDGNDSRVGGVSITFHVDDFPACLAELRARGLEPENEVEDADGRFAFFRDPEGYEVGIWSD